jgi:hypothetical protein
MGSQAAESTSQTRKISTPTAMAFSISRRFGRGVRRRPMGKPMRMVEPAMKPSSRVLDSSTDTLRPRRIRFA